MHVNLGSLLMQQGEYKKAIMYFKKAIKIDPNESSSLTNLATIYRELAKPLLANKYYELSLKSDPENAVTIAAYIYHLKWQCEWKKIDKLKKRLSKIDTSNYERPPITPFFSVIAEENFKKNLINAKQWSAITEEKNTITKKLILKKNKKITIGYVSNGFKDFPTGHKIAGLLKHHNKNKFKIICFSHGTNDKTKWRKQIEKDSDEFIDLKKANANKFDSEIRRRNIDILVDLKGHTKGSRLDVFSMRPAKTQISWLGFPGTTGTNFIDYFLADKTVVRPKEKKYFTEKVIYFPQSYQFMNDKAPIAKTKYKKSDFGLPENIFVFSSFNQSYKIEPHIWRCWMQILKDAPNSVLWVWAEGKAIQNLNTQAKNAGVNPNRLIFAFKINRPHHLKRLSFTDLALDTHIVNGHTTTMDYLYMNVPVITLKGNHFASRVSESILNSLKLNSLTANNLEEYKKIAIKYYSNKVLLADLKDNISRNKNKSSSFNTKIFTKTTRRNI